MLSMQLEFGSDTENFNQLHLTSDVIKQGCVKYFQVILPCQKRLNQFRVLRNFEFGA